MADLPPGRWSALLVGAWWPGPPTAATAGATHWNNQAALKDGEADDLDNRNSQLSRNQGRTAEDLQQRFADGAKAMRNIGLDCQEKARECKSAAEAVDGLRKQLQNIARNGNPKIDDILSDKKAASGEIIARINAAIFDANTAAIGASGDAMGKIIAATQRVLDVIAPGTNARTWMRDHGVSTDGPARPAPLTPEDLHRMINGSDAVGDDGASPVSHGASETGSSAPPGPSGAPAVGDDGASPVSHGASETGSSAPPGPSGAPAVGDDGALNGAGVGTGSGGFHGGGGVPTGVGGGGHVPSGGVPSGLGGGGGGLSPAALGKGLSPDSLGQSFSSGVNAGQPAAAGAQSLTAGTMHAAAQPPAAPSAPLAPVASTVATGGMEHAPVQHVSAAGAPVVSTGVGETPSSASSTVVAGPVAAPLAPVGGAPVAPAGPLPAYGADLRPPVVAASAPPSVGPMAGAPVAPSPLSSPAAGGSMMSPVERTAAAAAQGQTSGGAVAGAGLASAAGAAAGGASKRLAERADLQRKVDAVARQEPAIAWAAGLLDNGTTVLVTDLAGGWIPPYIKLPAGVSLLAPAARRRDVGVVDLLGAVVAAAAYQPSSYISEPGPDDPVLTGERARYGLHVDELGPTLVDAVRRRAGLPRIAQAVAGAAVRRTGVLDSEADLIREEAARSRRHVLSSYPEREASAIGDWMLLSAIEAAIAEDDEITKYHLAWFDSLFATTTGRP